MTSVGFVILIAIYEAPCKLRGEIVFMVFPWYNDNMLVDRSFISHFLIALLVAHFIKKHEIKKTIDCYRKYNRS